MIQVNLSNYCHKVKSISERRIKIHCRVGNRQDVNTLKLWSTARQEQRRQPWVCGAEEGWPQKAAEAAFCRPCRGLNRPTHGSRRGLGSVAPPALFCWLTTKPITMPPTEEFPYGQLIGGGPQPARATWLEGIADADRLELKMNGLAGNRLHAVTLKPLLKV